MKILILTTYFYPTNCIAAFRMNAFAKYFRQAGHEVTVIAEGAEDKTEQWEGCEVRYVKDPVIPYYVRKRVDGELGRRWTPRRMLKALEGRVTGNPSYFWSLKAAGIARHLLADGRTDVLLSTYGYELAAHLCALRLHDEFPQLYWIADFRDEPNFKHQEKSNWRIPIWHGLLMKSLKRRMQRVLDRSDLLLSVSKPIVEELRRTSSHGRVLEIRNGYDYPEVYDTHFQPRFTMAYLGHFYATIHPDNWFRAYAELIDEGRLPADGIIKIVGNTEPIWIPEAIRANVVEIPAVSHDEAVRISICETDVLVMIYSTRARRKGVYSGKLLDYLATNKPLLAIYDPDEVVGSLMKETGAGFAVGEEDIPAIKEAIMKCFGLWKRREVLPRNWDRIKEHRRSHQVGLLLDYLEKKANKS